MSELIKREDVLYTVEQYFKDAYIMDADLHLLDLTYEINHIPAASPWHRVEEPPKDSKPVLCWEKQGFPYIDRYFPKYGWEFANNGLAEPIYWMSIEPPKEDA